MVTSNDFEMGLLVMTRSVVQPGGCACIHICVVELHVDTGQPMVSKHIVCKSPS